MGHVFMIKLLIMLTCVINSLPGNVLIRSLQQIAIKTLSDPLSLFFLKDLVNCNTFDYIMKVSVFQIGFQSTCILN